MYELNLTVPFPKVPGLTVEDLAPPELIPCLNYAVTGPGPTGTGS